MFLLLVVIGVVSSTGWHASVYRLGVDGCNDFKSQMEQGEFCGSWNLQCERQEGFKILGDSAAFKGHAELSPSVEGTGTWVDLARSWGLEITEPMASQCDVLRLSALVGTPWDTINSVLEPYAIILTTSHKYRIVQGNIPRGNDYFLRDGLPTIPVVWESSVELYVLIEGTDLNLVVDFNGPASVFTPQRMGFKSTRRWWRKSISDDDFLTLSEPFFFAEDLRNGFLQSPTAKCTNDRHGTDSIMREMLRANERGVYVASCENGWRKPKFTMRKASSNQSAIAVCVADSTPAGDDRTVVMSEVPMDYSTALKLCHQKEGLTIPTLTQVRNEDFCNRIYPFGHMYYMWVRNNVGEQPENVETVEDMIPHADIFDTSNQDELIVRIADTYTIANTGMKQHEKISDEFPQLMSSEHRWAIVAQFSYPKKCHILETTVSYKPLGAGSDTITHVSRWMVSRQQGIWSLGEHYVINDGLDRLAIEIDPEGLFSAIERIDGGVNRPQGHHLYTEFLPFAEVNYISGNTVIRPWGPPAGLNIGGDFRSPKFYIHQRSYFAVDTLSQCSFGFASNYWYYATELWGVGANFNANGNIGEKWTVSRHTHTVQDYENKIRQTSQNHKLTLVPGRFYYLSWRAVEPSYKWQRNMDFKAFSMLWDCGEGIEVVPRKHFFSIGNVENHIISDVAHIDLSKKSQFRMSLSAPPPSAGTRVFCTGPSSLVITPRFFDFSGSDWSEMRVVTVYSRPRHDRGGMNPDSFIQCNSADLNPLSISITFLSNDAQHFLVSPSGHYANWFKNGNVWSVRDASLAPNREDAGCVYNLLDYRDSDFSFYIQTKHDSAQAHGIEIGPLVGVAFAYGPYVSAAYSSVVSNRWEIYRMSSAGPGGPKVSRLSPDDPINPGMLKIEFPCGSNCKVIPHGDHFMQLSCVVSGSFTKSSFNAPSCLSPALSFFDYPGGGTNNIISKTAVPAWPIGYVNNDQMFATVLPPSVLAGKSIEFPNDHEKMSEDEVSDFISWKATLENGADFGWNGVQNKCPLMSDKVYNALRPFTRPQVASWVSEMNLPQFIRSILKQCQADYFMQKFLDCLGPYQFNLDDATQSFRGAVFDFVSVSRLASANIEMVGRGLTLLVDNGKPGHLCSKRGHLVGSPPICACIANSGAGNVYPNCLDTVDCPAATKWQLNVLGSLVNLNVGTDFCSAEKSIVIVRSLGVSINCFRGFCYYWSSPKVRTGLKYEMCVTPYCVTGYSMEQDGTVTWYGLTECGETVTSSNNGDTWSISSTPFPDSAPVEYRATPVAEQKVVVPLTDPEYYEVAASSIVRAGVSSGKMVTVSLKWWCECVDPDTWNLLL